MSTAGLFVMGVVVSLIVVSAIGLLVWGAVQDGRAEAARQGEQQGRADGR